MVCEGYGRTITLPCAQTFSISSLLICIFQPIKMGNRATCIRLCLLGKKKKTLNAKATTYPSTFVPPFSIVLLVKILLTKVSSGAHDDLVHKQRSTMMDFKFHIPFGHSSQHSLGLDISIRIEYTCRLSYCNCSSLTSPMCLVIKPYRY